MMDTPAGWYPDPEQAGQQRYWDGQQWTEHRAEGYAVTQQQAQTLRASGRRKAFIVLGFAAVVGLIVWVGVSASEKEQPSSSQAGGPPAVTEEEEPLEPATFKAKVTATRVLSPASLTVFALVKNTSDVEGRASCFVYASDPSGAYKGYDRFNVRGGFIEPGEKRLLRADLIVTNEGAIWATDVSVECEDRDV